MGKCWSHTPETIEKIRRAKLGDRNPAKRPEVREKIRRNNAMKRAEVREKVKRKIVFLYEKGHNMGFQKGHPVFSGAEEGWMRKEDGPWECKYCGKIFNDRFSLGGHISVDHGNGGKGLQGWREKHDVWNKGLGQPDHYAYEFTEELKEMVRERDGYRCKECDRTQKEEVEERRRKLSVHHIDGNKKNNKLRNLLTLCSPCHLKMTNEMCKEVLGYSHRMD